MQPSLPHCAVIGFGANLGNARQTLKAAFAFLQNSPHTNHWRLSPCYKTAPIGAEEAQPDYINAVAQCRTDLSADALMIWLLETERHFGRDRSANLSRNAPRTLDLDLLLYDQQSLQSPLLTLPHPRLHERAFVLRPLLDILPNCTAPGLGALAAYLPRVRDQQTEKLDESADLFAHFALDQ